MQRPKTALALPEWLLPSLFPEILRERLESVCDVHSASPVQLGMAPATLDDVEVLVTGWGTPPLDEAVLERVPALRLIAHSAGTVRALVTPAVWRRSIRVSSAASANAVPVAEFTIGAIVLAAKGAFFANNAAHQRSTELELAAVADAGFYQRCVGLVGASRIGRMVIERLRDFDVEVLLHDPTLSASEAAALGVEGVELDELLARADVVSLHAPLLPATEGMIGAGELARMRDGTTLINTARGKLVDSAALGNEVGAGRLRAVIDTYDPEPVPMDSPLRGNPNVFLTPHLAGSRGREIERMAHYAIDEIERFVRGESMQGEVTERDMEWVA